MTRFNHVAPALLAAATVLLALSGCERGDTVSNRGPSLLATGSNAASGPGSGTGTGAPVGTEPGTGTGTGVTSGTSMADATGTGASGASGGTPGAPATNTCQDTTAVDYSATSLAHGVTPLPGPALLYEATPRAPQLENTGAWQAAPILVSGASAYRCGEFLYQDWLYDDRGAAGTADPGDPHDPGNYLFSPYAGTLTYPTGAAYANNAADLVEFRVKALPDATLFRVTLNTLIDPKVVGLTLALGDAGTTVAWPHAANVKSPAQLFLTVKGANVELLDATHALAPVAGATLATDLERRQLTITVPRTAWDPGSTTVRMALGLGLWDAAAGQYAQPGAAASATAPGGAAAPSGAAALFNVAFRKGEPAPDFTVSQGRTIGDAALYAKTQAQWWRERRQADALKAGNVGDFFANVDFAKLRSGATDDTAIPRTGAMDRIFASRFAPGQGQNYATACGGVSVTRPCKGVLAGQLMPYAIYVPDKPAPAKGYGLTVMPHALSANYNQYLSSRHQQELGERGTGTVVITGTARGPDGFYYDTAQADIFEVWADAARHYPLDPARTVMTGISMGGIGSFSVAARYPDLFARIMPVVASSMGSDDGLPSLRNVPIMMWSCGLDELQPLVDTEPTITKITGLGYRLDSYRFEQWDHLTPSTNDYYAPGAAFLLDDAINRNPAHVTFVSRPGEGTPDERLVADKAYWVSGVVLADASTGKGSVDVVSEGLGSADPVPQAVAQTTLNQLDGGYQQSSALFTRRLLAWAAPTSAPIANRLRITTSNVKQLTIDPQRAGVGCDAELKVTSDVLPKIILAGC